MGERAFLSPSWPTTNYDTKWKVWGTRQLIVDAPWPAESTYSNDAIAGCQTGLIPAAIRYFSVAVIGICCFDRSSASLTWFSRLPAHSSASAASFSAS
jgi:hypothetical protein